MAAARKGISIIRLTLRRDIGLRTAWLSGGAVIPETCDNVRHNPGPFGLAPRMKGAGQWKTASIGTGLNR